MALMLSGGEREALRFLGYDWPATNEDTLKGYGDEWKAFEATCSRLIDRLNGAVSTVGGGNEGDAFSQFKSYMTGSDSNTDGIRSFGTAAGVVGNGYRLAGNAIYALKLLIIGKLAALAASIAVGILTGGLMFLVSMGARKAAEYAIDIAIDRAIMSLTEG
ncbi:WXG100-like domain-containing protein [Mariniluteicoccus flavus]